MSEYISKEDINRVLLERIGANKSCVIKAKEIGLHETKQYFNNLLFEDGQIASLIEGLPSASFPDSAENKGDLISRQAVLDELEKWDWQELYLPIHFKQILDDVPSVEIKDFEGMTNGEVIKALFPDSYFLNDFPFSASSMEKIYIDNNKDNKTHIMAQEDWWNAPYKGESEDKE